MPERLDYPYALNPVYTKKAEPLVFPEFCNMCMEKFPREEMHSDPEYQGKLLCTTCLEEWKKENEVDETKPPYNYESI